MSTARHNRARVAALSRWRDDHAADLVDAQRRLREDRLADYIKKTVDEAPPLTPEQRQRLAVLLSGGDAA